MDPVAQQAAQFQADDMAAAGMLRHTDSRGRNPYQRYQAFGGSIRSIGENVANDSSVTLDPTLIWTVMSCLDADMMAEKAPNDGHRRNILASIFNEVGIGIAVSKSGVFFCEDFSGPPLPG